MTAAWLMARSGVRRHAVSLVVLAVLVGMAGSVVLAATIGARRNSTAPARLSEQMRFWDLSVTLAGKSRGLAQRIAELPSVDAWIGATPVGRREPQQDWYYPFAGARRSAKIWNPVVVEGRMFDNTAPGEVVISAGTARSTGLSVGDSFTYAIYDADQFRTINEDVDLPPAGPTPYLNVTGIVLDPRDSENSRSQKFMFASPAFFDAYADFGVGTEVHVRLADGPAGIDRFEDQVRELARKEGLLAGQTPFSVQFRTAEESSAGLVDAQRVMVLGLIGFAVVAAVTGLVGVGQAAARQLNRAARDHWVLAALGTTGRTRVFGYTLPLVASAVGGTVLAVMGAIALSPLFPMGSAGSLEPRPGFEVNVAWLTIGAVGIGVVTMTLFGILGWRADRRAARLVRGERRHSRGPANPLWRRLVQWPALSTGVRMAIDRGRGRNAVPVKSSLAGVAGAVTLAVALVVFSTSLGRLADTPARFGQDYDLRIELASGTELCPDAQQMAGVLWCDKVENSLQSLTKDPDVASVTIGYETNVDFDGRSVQGFAFDRPELSEPLVLHDGRAPETASEVALGPALMRDLGVDIGQTVQVSSEGVEPLEFEVVGSALAPDYTEDMAGQAIFTPNALDVVTPNAEAFPEAIVTYRDGVDADAVTARLDGQYPYGVTDESEPEQPPSVGNLTQLRALPLYLGLFVGLLGLAVLVHTLVMSGRRRAGEMAILRSLGFTPREAGRSFNWMASMTLGIGLALGVPLGLILGTVWWGRVAAGLDVAPDANVPVLIVIALIPAVLVVANLMAFIPRVMIMRRRPAELLRTE